MFGRILVLGLLPVALAVNAPRGMAATQKTALPPSTTLSALWESPEDLSGRDLFTGPWSPAHVPDPDAVYTYVRPKQGGTNPGVVVQDPLGREWHVKQPPHTDQGTEGPVEVTLSRVLSAVGYHQPPVYFVPSFLIRDASGIHRVPGGRFRLTDANMRSRGEWSWRENPFVGMRPFEGLLAILLIFNSADLKDSNNTLYEVRGPGGHVVPWYVVRDLGSALGDTRRFTPRRNNLELFEKQGFITGVQSGFVTFSYHASHQSPIRNRIRPDDAGWAGALLARLSDRQWDDAFRAGHYTPDVAARYIRKLHANIARARQVADDESRRAPERR
jgi:hypothetical protein